MCLCECACACECINGCQCQHVRWHVYALHSSFLFLALQQPKLTVPPFLPFVMSQMALVARPRLAATAGRGLWRNPHLWAPRLRRIIIPLPPSLKSGNRKRKQKNKRLDCKHGAKQAVSSRASRLEATRNAMTSVAASLWVSRSHLLGHKRDGAQAPAL